MNTATSPTHTASEAPCNMRRLESLHQRIAALRLQSEACTPDCPVRSLPMARVFTIPKKRRDVLVSDRDVSKRDEKIFAVLKERGEMRLLGAGASEDMAAAIGKLHVSHPNFSTAVNYILGEEMLARQNKAALCGLRILLHGAPGIGKTDFCLSLADLLGLPAEVISMSSSQASAQLGGSEEYWSNSQPGAVWKKIIQGTHANPLFVLDEVDKAPTNWGDPLGALFQLLEQKSAAIFCDKSVPWLPVNASLVNWIATANDVEKLHPALRSRFIEVEVQAPSEVDLMNLMQRLYQGMLTEFSLNERFPPELDMREKTRLLRTNVREAKQLLRRALARALRENRNELSIHDPGNLPATPRRIGFL